MTDTDNFNAPFDLPASATDPTAYSDAMARVAAIRERTRGRRSPVDLERELGAELLASAEADRVTESEGRDDAPDDLLASRMVARLTVALIGWVVRRHARVTKGDREGPGAWTDAPVGATLVGEAPFGVADVPAEDPACLAAFDGTATSHAERVSIIERTLARYRDTWISLPDDELAKWYGVALASIGAAQQSIDEWQEQR